MSSKLSSFLRSKNFSSIVEADVENKAKLEKFLKDISSIEEDYTSKVSELSSAI